MPTQIETPFAIVCKYPPFFLCVTGYFWAASVCGFSLLFFFTISHLKIKFICKSLQNLFLILRK